jgi:biotin transport system substrate-specific component
MSRAVAPLTFVDAVWPSQGGSRVVRGVVLALIGSVLLTLSAKVQVPFYPVPMTMQTLVVLLLGMALGPRLGTAAVLLYLAEGAVGLPVFAGTPARGIGIAYMLGPTGGYLLGFVIAAGLTGWIVERRRDWAGLAAAVIGGTMMIYVPGVLWLSGFVGMDQAVALGVLPFLFGDLAKAALAMVLALSGAVLIERRLARRSER